MVSRPRKYRPEISPPLLAKLETVLYPGQRVYTAVSQAIELYIALLGRQEIQVALLMLDNDVERLADLFAEAARTEIRAEIG